MNNTCKEYCKYVSESPKKKDGIIALAVVEPHAWSMPFLVLLDINRMEMHGACHASCSSHAHASCLIKVCKGL